MIDRTLDTSESARLPVPAGLGRGLVLGSVFVCAACGLVYELELVALASYLAGDTVTQASVVLSVMVFAMGVGSLLAKRLRCCAATGFGTVEALLALVGGGSAMALYASFAWLDAARGALVVFSLAIGVLTGAEMPLLMTLIQRVRKQDPSGAVADLFAADYVGALVGGLTFPFLLLPFFGQLTGALLTGVVNAAAGGVVVLWLFRRDVSSRVRWGLCALNAGALLLLIAGTAFVGPFEQAARQAVYGAGVRVAVHSDVQEIVLTGSADPASGGPVLRLYLDGRLRASSTNESRYHRQLVAPAMSAGRHGRVLILGGGDGLALREVLRYPGVREVTVLDADPAFARLARTDPGLRRLNGGAFRDPRVRLRTGDVFRRLRSWVCAHGRGAARTRKQEAREARKLREASGARGAQRVRKAGTHGTHGVRGKPWGFPYDVIVSDLPEPVDSASAKLYTQEFYGLAARSLAPRGRIAVHAGALTGRPRDYWTVDATLRATGLRTVPYAVEGSRPRDSGPHAGRRPGTGGPRDWGFVLAFRERGAGPVRGARSVRPLESLASGESGASGASGGDAVRASRTRGVTGRPGGPGADGIRGAGVPGSSPAESRPDAQPDARPESPPAALSAHELRAARQLAERHRMRGLPPSTLMHPRY